jgi:hypothetical protein
VEQPLNLKEQKLKDQNLSFIEIELDQTKEGEIE